MPQPARLRCRTGAHYFRRIHPRRARHRARAARQLWSDAFGVPRRRILDGRYVCVVVCGQSASRSDAGGEVEGGMTGVSGGCTYNSETIFDTPCVSLKPAQEQLVPPLRISQGCRLLSVLSDHTAMTSRSRNRHETWQTIQTVQPHFVRLRRGPEKRYARCSYSYTA